MQVQFLPGAPIWVILLPMKRFAIFIWFLTPAVAIALSFEDQTDRYTDSPFNSAVTAGVSVLTEVGAIEGNPDGTFQPDRLLNRAEFLKIVLKSYPQSTVDIDEDAGNCFPDVGQWDWFSPYVCYAKAQGIVGGYPDGYFRPDNAVNYAEALKMLGELYDVQYAWDELPGNPDPAWKAEHWYVPYNEGAMAAGVELPGGRTMDYALTRGEMARLAAAYLAHFQDQLAQYRATERGAMTSSVSSAAPAEECCRSSSSVSPESSGSSASSLGRWTHPTPSRFLLIGSQTLPFASGVFQFSEPMDIRSVTVEMKKEIKSIREMHLIDNRGRALLTLKPDVFDELDRKWKGEAGPNEATVGPGSLPLGIEATMRTALQGGFPEEFIEAKTMSLIVSMPGDIQTSQALPVEWSHPGHQTANALLEKVENAGPREGAMTLGANQQVALFRFSGKSTGATLRVENLLLTPRMPAGITVQNWRIARADGGGGPCSYGSDGFVTCPLTEEKGLITGGALTLAIFGDVSMAQGTQGPTLQLVIDDPGSLTTFGAVQWSDGTGHYRWMEGEAPIAKGTAWEG